MKKTVFYLLLTLVLVLAACGNNSEKENSGTDSKDSKDTVTIKNNYELSGEKKDGSDAKKVNETVKVPKNPKNAVVLDYGALDVMKEMGLADKVKALPKGEGGKSLPDFLSDFKEDKYTNTGNLKEVNFDKVAETKPEVIFISGRTANQKNMDEFKKAAPKAKIVYVGSDDKQLVKSMKSNTTNIGKIYDKEDKAKELNKKLDDKIDSMKDKTKKFDKSVMYLLVNEGELSTYGPKGRFGSLVFDTLGFKPVDKDVSDSTHGQNVSNEYINKENPDVILAMDRGQAISGKSTAKKTLNNAVLKDVNAVKEDKVYNLDPKLWYFSSGSTTTTVKQIEELEKVVE
ncbi:siderophore ABC transporter substrate-binding protein [Staphylococcus simiae]|uniref:ferrated catecholamine ABC transporter substrate-binding lipoprotein SstD n=1 Tax=Staphylococcus simiae TaxID=308354 RepID=UPI001A96822F|nr:siderophore ABC transporter substrate-binding protein [Staphylococcus simiae]MBO1198779.1 siderophore ABC transporter substrate-binding protein [Staphylococcus simiae]MBO1200726.1 siderophore ABC transporter substrate-binding protein [Staphylococcus simiae]MBO1203239.1 siderophore ABC transporter substrate-binding protein [Staphylococcus simiae]MBO1210590.1 siderophore ABC transporter substrate-binding protein [Staphylococcus simiae]MBO1229062.1 siderophore ABC transporter substrate-binding